MNTTDTLPERWIRGLALLAGVFLMPSSWAQACGDCNQDGVVNVSDALASAQHGVGLISLVTPGFEFCNIMGLPGGPPTGIVDILDALEIATYSAGLTASLACSAPPVCTITQPASGTLPGDLLVNWHAIDFGSLPVSLFAEWSSDGGGSFGPASMGSGGDGVSGLASSPAPGNSHLYSWDTLADGAGVGGAEPVVLRFTISNARGATTCTTTFCVGVGAVQLPGVWTEIRSDPFLAPPARAFHTLVHDPGRSRLVLSGGYHTTELPSDRTDVWAFDLITNQWSELHPPCAFSAAGHSAVFDVPNDRMIILGGLWSTAVCPRTPWKPVWQLDFTVGPDGAWSEVVDTYDPGMDVRYPLPVVGAPYGMWRLVPNHLLGHTYVDTGGRQRLVCLLGDRPIQIYPSGPVGQAVVIECDLSGGGAHFSDVLPATGSIPYAPWMNHMVYDQVEERLLTTRGCAGYSCTQGVREFRYKPTGPGGVWTNLLPACGVEPGEPAGRQGSPFGHDPVRRRAVMTHGATQLVGELDTTWLYDIPRERWVQIVPVGAFPPERKFHAFIYDPTNDRYILYGGRDGFVIYDDTWELRF